MRAVHASCHIHVKLDASKAALGDRRKIFIRLKHITSPSFFLKKMSMEVSSAATALNEFSRLLFIGVGSSIFILGLFGSCANLYLFGRRRYRQIPCSLFIWIGALLDLILLCIALFLYRILNQILKYDLMAPNLFLCKVRLYLIDALLPAPIWCVCLSAFDRFSMTSRDVARRRWCTPRRCRIMVATLVVICLIFRVPDLYYVTTVYNTTGPPSCTIVPIISAYTTLQSYFTFPVLLTAGPITLLIILSFLTRANLRQFAAQETGVRLERQITLMVLLQALGAGCIVPYAINNYYTLATRYETKSDYRRAVENLIFQIVSLGFYAHYAVAFYIYLIASSDVRRSVRLVWHKITRTMPFGNQITPANDTVHRDGVPSTATKHRSMAANTIM